MYVSRSFDVNRPGTTPDKLKGGVLGGTLLQGELKVGDEIEILPGIIEGKKHAPLTTKIVSLRSQDVSLERARPGGLIAVGTLLDPSLTKADKLKGAVLGKVGELPPVVTSIEAEVHLMDWVIGLKEKKPVEPLKRGEILVLNIGTATQAGIVSEVDKDVVSLTLRFPACVEEGQRIAISRNIGGRYRLIGYGIAR